MLLAKGAVEIPANDVGWETGPVRVITAKPVCDDVGR